MNSVYHSSLEREIVLELNPFAGAMENGQTPMVQRETVLAMVARSAQLSLEFRELLNEAGLLVASALEMEYFGSAEVRRTDLFHIHWGKVSDCTHNIDPVSVEVPWNTNRTSFGFAIDAAHPVLVSNAENETRFRDPFLSDNHVRCGVICPINYRDHQYGAMGIFTTQPRTLSKSDVMFVQSIALLLGPTRAHQNAERTLAEHSRFLSTAIDSLDALVVLLSSEGNILQINRACQTWSGFHGSELKGRAIWNAFCVPSDSDSVQLMLNELRDRTGQRRCETALLTKSGDQRQVSWTFSRLSGEGGGAAFLATGIDVTEQFGALSKLHPTEPLTNSAAPTSESLDDTPSAAALLASDRRTHDRRPYSCVQSIAACVDGMLPERQQFRAVRCHDISPRGFSFLLSASPNFSELVAAFGSAQSRLFLRARVVHQSPFRHEGRNVLLIGCEYTGRVRLPWALGEGAR